MIFSARRNCQGGGARAASAKTAVASNRKLAREIAMPRRRKPLYTEIVGSQAVKVDATQTGWVRWIVTSTGPLPRPGLVLWLDAIDIISLGKRSVAALKRPNL